MVCQSIYDICRGQNVLGGILCFKWSCIHYNKWAMSWENLFMPFANNKAADQPVQSDQCLYYSLPRYYNISSFYIQNFKTLASFWRRADRFESYLVGNPRRQVFSWRSSYSRATLPTSLDKRKPVYIICEHKSAYEHIQSRPQLNITCQGPRNMR